MENIQRFLTTVTDTWPHTFLFLSFAGGIASWIIAVIPFLRIANELARARQAGEAVGIPPSTRGLPPVVIFTKGLLARVELERRVLMWAIIAFTGFWMTAVILAGIYGPISSPPR